MGKRFLFFIYSHDGLLVCCNPVWPYLAGRHSHFYYFPLVSLVASNDYQDKIFKSLSGNMGKYSPHLCGLLMYSFENGELESQGKSQLIVYLLVKKLICCKKLYLGKLIVKIFIFADFFRYAIIY